MKHKKTERACNGAARDTGVRLSWEETARAMAASSEDWSDWDVTLADGLDLLPWDPAPRRRLRKPNTRGE